MEGAEIGPYQVLRGLGRGGMGAVYLARVAGRAPGLEEGREVALKIIHPHLLETPGFFRRFLREADIGQAVNHENVVRTFLADATLHEGVQQNFLVMEYVEGQTLRELFQDLERVPEELCRHIGREVANGLAAIHAAGAVHRDLKPENVLITADHVVKVMDLGVAKLTDEAIRLSQTGAFVGSLEYAAPEQFQSAEGPPDGRADLHALGVLLYELSTGQHPFRDSDISRLLNNILHATPRKPGELNPQLSPFFEEAVQTLLAKEARARFASAAVLARVLEEGEAGSWWSEKARALRDETRRPLRRIRIPRETALYGRNDDLAWLRAAYDRAQAGAGQVLLLEGEAGIGKTRLVDEFVAGLGDAGEDLNFLFGSNLPGGAATATGAFATAYREQLGPAGSAPYLPGSPDLVPRFDALVRGDPVPPGVEPLTKDVMHTAFVRATRALAEERPTVVLIEDLHFAPKEGRALFAALALAVPSHPILLIGTTRPGLPEAWTVALERHEHTSRRTLLRLGPKDLAELIEDAFQSERLAEELGHRIARKCDGNPFFTFEIIRGLKEGHLVVREADGTWVTTGSIREIEVPSSVTDLVQARIADLEENDKNLLDVAACCGFEFDPLLVAEALGVAQIPTMQRLARIESRHRLVRARGRRFAFDHHQVQEALYQGMPELLREPYHAAIGDALARRVTATDQAPAGETCVAMCHHFLKGGEAKRCLPYLDAALRHLSDGSLNEEVIRLTAHVLAVPGLLAPPRRFDLLMGMQEAEERVGDRGAQRRTLDEAESLLEVLDDKARLRWERAMGVLHTYTGAYEEALHHFERQRDLAASIGDRRMTVRAVGSLGNVYHEQGRMEEARDHLERWARDARELGDVEMEGSALGNLGLLMLYTGQVEEGRDLLERSRDLAEQAGDARGVAAAVGNLGLVFMQTGELGKAASYFEQLRDIGRRQGDRPAEAVALGNLASIPLQLGELERGRVEMERFVDLARELGDRASEALGTTNAGEAYRGLGRYAEALDHSLKALPLVQDVGAPRIEANVCNSLAMAYRDVGAYAEAETWFEKKRLLSEELGDLQSLGFCVGEWGEMRRSQGRWAEAVELLERRLTLSRKAGDLGGEAYAHLGLGAVAVERGDMDAAAKELDRAAQGAAEVGTPELLLRTQVWQARLPGADPDAAERSYEEHGNGQFVYIRVEALHCLYVATEDDRYLDEAVEWIDHLVEHAPDEYRRSLREDVRLHREVLQAAAERGGAA